VAGAAIAVNVADGFSRFTVSVPVVLPAGIVPEQVTPGGKVTDVFEGQVRVIAALNPPLCVTVMVEVVELIVPAAPAVVVTVAAVAVNVKLPPLPIVPVKEKFKTLLPPKATGLGSKAPNELAMM
jgi:hypothetical protein